MILFLLACGGAPAPEAHDHDAAGGHDPAKTEAHGQDHDEAHGHDHDEAHGHGAKTPVDAAAIEAPVGAGTGRLVPGDTEITLSVIGADGAPLTAEGEARMVLTGTGEAEQRVVLTADGTVWKGPAKARGARGYLAVVSVPVGGSTQSGRFVWGDVPEAAPAPAPHDHGDGGHDHGDHGHDH